MCDSDPAYLAYIRSLPCLVCGVTGVDPHHQPRAGHGSTGSKCSDHRAVPLCRKDHDLYHDSLSWQLYALAGIDVEAAICDMQMRYFFAQSVAYIE